jgi:hypothetical protein
LAFWNQSSSDIDLSNTETKIGHIISDGRGNSEELFTPFGPLTNQNDNHYQRSHDRDAENDEDYKDRKYR